MSFRMILFTIVFAAFLFGCEKSVETTFGAHCRKISFNTEKKSFKSDNDGSFTFQIEESTDKSFGNLIIGNFSSIELGKKDLLFKKDITDGDYSDTIFLFNRDGSNEDDYFYADSGKIEVDFIHRLTKGNIAFIRGYFYRLVFVNTKGECKVIERLDFVFY